jgi:cysteinyl-tRNA synthetase
MAAAHLGQTFDIHGGGIDLVFPHHENEIAQSRCAFHTPVMAQVWMHNGFLQVEGEKMAKSSGNFVTVHELLNDWPGEVVRFAMLQTHYRQPINWTADQLFKSRDELSSWAVQVQISRAHSEVLVRRAVGREAEPADTVIEALSDDLNTPLAITRLRELYERGGSDFRASVALLESCEFLGLLTPDRLGVHFRGVTGSAIPEKQFKHFEDVQRIRAAIANNLPDQVRSLRANLEADGVDVVVRDDGWVSLESKDETEDSRILKLIAARNAARAAKDFKEADRIRTELEAMGIELKDSKDPKTGELVTTWEVAR